MKFLPLVLKHLLRNWVRSGSTIAAMALSVMVFCTLQSALDRLNHIADTRSPRPTAIRAIAAFLAVGMGVGAVFGAMNTMYALVATRTREIGTLRALGFSRRAILLSLVLESALLALLGGGLGCALAFSMHGYSTGAANVRSMSEIAYAFRISPEVVLGSLVFAVAMGVAGGLLPAARAARLPIAAAVRGI